MADRKLTKEDCIEFLRDKYSLLTGQGLERYPQRQDFSESEVVAIKAFLGPWPRALEMAGIKPPRDKSTATKSKEKRICTKRRRIAVLKARQAQEKNANTDPKYKP